ncbi:MAG: hypothetical protein JSR00_06025 [Bacteroidetes bacterium]|nr:hypothetical protein [Bacteroidota bacterium]
MRFTVCFIALIISSLFAASQDVAEMQETARSFMRKGDFANSTLVLTKAIQMEPENMSVAKDLALSYYYQKNFQKALQTIKPVIESSQTDDQCFQIAANIYLSLQNFKEAENTYKTGLKKFPASGGLYNDYGELLWGLQDNSAINQWENGMAADPSFAKNYYNSSRFYYLTGNFTRTLIYGEIFINIDPLNSKTPEIKEMLLESYKKIFTLNDIVADSKPSSPFEKAILETLDKQKELAAFGLTVDALTMIRSRFIINWFENYNTKFPFYLFEYEQQLLASGLYEAYNYWVFGAAANLAEFQKWVSNNSTQYSDFIKFHKSKLFKMPAGQFYK